MAERQASRQFEQTAQKWRALAERRRADFIELYQSGRWKYYYDEQDFIAQMREVASTAEMWASIAPAPPAREEAASDKAAAFPATPQRRSAA